MAFGGTEPVWKKDSFDRDTRQQVRGHRVHKEGNEAYVDEQDDLEIRMLRGEEGVGVDATSGSMVDLRRSGASDAAWEAGRDARNASFERNQSQLRPVPGDRDGDGIPDGVEVTRTVTRQGVDGGQVRDVGKFVQGANREHRGGAPGFITGTGISREGLSDGERLMVQRGFGSRDTQARADAREILGRRDAKLSRADRIMGADKDRANALALGDQKLQGTRATADATVDVAEANAKGNLDVATVNQGGQTVRTRMTEQGQTDRAQMDQDTEHKRIEAVEFENAAKRGERVGFRTDPNTGNTVATFNGQMLNVGKPNDDGAQELLSGDTLVGWVTKSGQFVSVSGQTAQTGKPKTGATGADRYL